VTFALGKQSLSRLRGVHPLLVGVVVRAIRITSADFTVYEGLRSVERQRELFESGQSKKMNSRHLTGHAVDLPAYLNGVPVWDKVLAQPIMTAMMKAALDCGVTLRWGGDWDGDGDQEDETFRDLVHFELPKSVYV
jgi:peptidoglycan L-alanyl-D-glutamate endopeptidase CwlK